MKTYILKHTHMYVFFRRRRKRRRRRRRRTRRRKPELRSLCYCVKILCVALVSFDQ